ncbi:hypothetical protein XB02_04175 [Pantoea ananatis]|nr:hypothetical protein XB02_04175 [Pantoea ananatis]
MSAVEAKNNQVGPIITTDKNNCWHFAHGSGPLALDYRVNLLRHRCVSLFYPLLWLIQTLAEGQPGAILLFMTGYTIDFQHSRPHVNKIALRDSSRPTHC